MIHYFGVSFIPSWKNTATTKIVERIFCVTLFRCCTQPQEAASCFIVLFKAITFRTDVFEMKYFFSDISCIAMQKKSSYVCGRKCTLKMSNYEAHSYEKIIRTIKQVRTCFAFVVHSTHCGTTHIPCLMIPRGCHYSAKSGNWWCFHKINRHP